MEKSEYGKFPSYNFLPDADCLYGSVCNEGYYTNQYNLKI